MGKYMKKARGVGGVMEVMTQGQLGVRTRARAQAMEKKELIRSTSNNNKVSASSASTKSFPPSQISYLELRSRRLEKTFGCTSNKPPPAAQKSPSTDECRQLSDLTNSDILADDSSSRAALSTDDEARRTHRQTRHPVCDENREFVYHSHGDNEVEEEESLQGCVRRSLQQWRSRGRAPPAAAHSRSNSRSNSVTRELPSPPTPKLPPRGILTRNQRKMEKQISDTIVCIDGVADMDVQLDAFCNANTCRTSSKLNSDLARNADAEVSFGENPMDGAWFARDRFARERTPISHGRELNTTTFDEKLSPEPVVCKDQAAPSNILSALDMEIEDFFLQAEQQEQRRFIERYNFDPVNDTPLPGRYDWTRLKPYC
eukprot:c20886_g2_i1 orf=1101-2216(+)